MSRVVTEPIATLAFFSACVLSNPILRETSRSSSRAVCEDLRTKMSVVCNKVKLGRLTSIDWYWTQKGSMEFEMSYWRILGEITTD
jgi:hypothetical protein